MPRLCQSSCINRKPQAGWPILHILEELYAYNITVTAGLNHDELFKYRLTQEHSIDAQHLSAVTQTAVLPKGESKVKQSQLQHRILCLRPLLLQLLILKETKI